MSFLNNLDGILERGKAKLKEYSKPPPPSPPHPNGRRPPPIPSSTKPRIPHPPPPPIPPRPSSTNFSYSPAYWQPTFHPSTPISTHFIHETGAHGWGNSESQNYTSALENSFPTPDGKLIIRAIAQNGTYTSARLTSHQRLSRPRGCLSVTLVPPCATGVWPAFWLLPADPFKWPEDGEIDIFESWNGDCVNHSCLHWGHYNGEDWNKHKVKDTPMEDMPHRPHVWSFAWQEEEGRMDGGRGRLMWYIDHVAVMKATIPRGTRRMEDFRIIINVAMGGNVCGGKLPADGVYDLQLSGLKMSDEPMGGWEQFEKDWTRAPEGKTM